MFRLGGKDTASIKMWDSFPQGLFISELVNNSDKELQIFLRKTCLDDGAVLFQSERSVAIDDFRKLNKGKIDHLSFREVVAIINFYTQRLRNYAHLESLWQAEIDEARIIPAEIPRTGVCQFYEAKIISVKDAYNNIQWFKTLSSEEYGKQISTKDFSIPPFYLECRCRVEAIIPGVDY